MSMTIKDLKEYIKDLPETDEYDIPFEVWMMTGKGLSSPVNDICMLNKGDVIFSSEVWD